MSFWDDFRQGVDEARAGRAGRSSAPAPQQNSFLGGLFGSGAQPVYRPQHVEPASGPWGAHVDDGSQDWSGHHSDDWSAGKDYYGAAGPSPPQRDDPRLEQLATLCERQQSQIAQHQADLAAIGERLDGFVAAVAERDAAIAALQAALTETRETRDRFKTNGQKLLAEIRPLRVHSEAILKLGWHAMSKAAHPDTGGQENEAARAELFKLVKTIFGRN
jgi:hypothetical protein